MVVNTEPTERQKERKIINARYYRKRKAKKMLSKLQDISMNESLLKQLEPIVSLLKQHFESK